MRRAGVTFLLAALCASGAAAQSQTRWRFVASRMVQYSADPDVIRMRGFERSRQVRLCARGGAVELIAFELRFANDRRQDVPIRGMLRPGACTRAVDLARGRGVTELRLFYQRQSRQNPAWIRVEAR